MKDKASGLVGAGGRSRTWSSGSSADDNAEHSSHNKEGDIEMAETSAASSTSSSSNSQSSRRATVGRSAVYNPLSMETIEEGDEEADSPRTVNNPIMLCYFTCYNACSQRRAVLRVRSRGST